MEDQCDFGAISDRSCLIERIDSRVAGEKRVSVESGESIELPVRRVKMRDLESVVGSEEPETLNVGGSKAETTDKNHDESMDLNTEAVIANNLSTNDSLDDAENKGEQFSPSKPHREGNNKCVASKDVGLDLNVEVVSSSVNQASFHPSKNQINTRSRDISECGSTIGPLEDNDSLRRWNEMKENGFLSSSYGGKPVPKQRGRKTKADVLKKKMEIAKREQVDRFTKIAAPSGLLNELNPGIINYVRNRKQVHSIIESLVRSEKLENEHFDSKQANHFESQGNEISHRKDSVNMNDSGTNQYGFPNENECLNTLSESKQMRMCPMQVDDFIPEEKSGDDNSSMLERVSGKSCASNSIPLSEDDSLVLKLSSSTNNASENANSFSNEESVNLSSVSSLSVKAATVASQWLELLHQDIKGRLAALRCSKKRVRAVINTELPFLISKEFSSNQENEPNVINNSSEELSIDATAEMHRVRWTALFDKMEYSLSEEEKQLESWLNQVKEMQSHCDQGLQQFHWNSSYDLQQLGMLEDDSRSGNVDNPEKELAVHAAAASIYSTCNLLMSKENVSCF